MNNLQKNKLNEEEQENKSVSEEQENDDEKNYIEIKEYAGFDMVKENHIKIKPE